MGKPKFDKTFPFCSAFKFQRSLELHDWYINVKWTIANDWILPKGLRRRISSGLSYLTAFYQD